VPADRLHTSSAHSDDYEVNLTKAQIESFPPYDDNALESQQKWGTYETQYRSAWPATAETRAGKLGSRWSAFETRLRTDRDRIVAAPGRDRKVS
jgi:hypothetical protein